MNTLTKCKLALVLAVLITVPAAWALSYANVPFWVFAVVWPSLWLSGALFIVAMVGDFKEGLGLDNGVSS